MRAEWGVTRGQGYREEWGVRRGGGRGEAGTGAKGIAGIEYFARHRVSASMDIVCGLCSQKRVLEDSSTWKCEHVANV